MVRAAPAIAVCPRNHKPPGRNQRRRQRRSFHRSPNQIIALGSGKENAIRCQDDRFRWTSIAEVAQLVIGQQSPIPEQVAGAFINSGSSGTSTMALYAKNSSTAAGVALLGESFGTDSTAVFSNYSTGDIFRG